MGEGAYMACVRLGGVREMALALTGHSMINDVTM